jgi:hypothetical protein
MIENPEICIPHELVRDCQIAYSWTGQPTVLAAYEDHPAFAEVRKLLVYRGYIERPPHPCLNGDRVLKRFRFNGCQLQPGDKFYCAVAWQSILRTKNACSI